MHLRSLLGSARNVLQYTPQTHMLMDQSEPKYTMVSMVWTPKNGPKFLGTPSRIYLYMPSNFIHTHNNTSVSISTFTSTYLFMRTLTSPPLKLHHTAVIYHNIYPIRILVFMWSFGPPPPRIKHKGQKRLWPGREERRGIGRPKTWRWLVLGGPR